ncbi:MAG TPA: hypothetical protein VFZ58_01970 [Candidatus Saccharimonadales bacterium]
MIVVGLVVISAAIRGALVEDESPVVICSPHWPLPQEWQASGSVLVSEAGALKVLSGEIETGKTTVTSISSGLSVRIKQSRESQDFFVSNVGLSRVGFTFAEANDICHQELAPGEVVRFTNIAGGRHISLYEIS